MENLLIIIIVVVVVVVVVVVIMVISIHYLLYMRLYYSQVLYLYFNYFKSNIYTHN
jgi:cytochrome c oxidase subunit IV